jgi:tetratricopeptide (TPR) repeat protein
MHGLVTFVLLVVVSGCAPSLTLRRLARPSAALGDVRSFSLEVVPDKNTETLKDGGKISELVKANFGEALKSSRFTQCAPAPCGDGALRIALRDTWLDAPMTERPTPLVTLGADVTFTPANGGPARTQRSTSSVETRNPPDIVMRGMINDFATRFLERFAPRSSFTELTLKACDGCNPGLAQLHRGEWEAAATTFRALTTARPDDTDAWFDLGVALEAQGLWQSALEAFRKAGDQRSVTEITRMLGN